MLLLTDIYEMTLQLGNFKCKLFRLSHWRSEGCGFDSRLGLRNIFLSLLLSLSSKQFTFKITKLQVISYIYIVYYICVTVLTAVCYTHIYTHTIVSRQSNLQNTKIYLHFSQTPRCNSDVVVTPSLLL